MSMDFEIQFTDTTILQADGEYAEVCKIMESETKGANSLQKDEKWMVRSKIVILSPFGSATMTCHFYHNGKVYIVQYATTSKDIHTTDVRCLTHWCNEKGWKVPEPMSFVVDSWLEFWRKEWETYIIECSYLEKKLGPRREMEFDSPPIEDDEEDEFLTRIEEEEPEE